MRHVTRVVPRHPCRPCHPRRPRHPCPPCWYRSSAKSDSGLGYHIGREGHELAPTGRAECPHRSHLPVEGIRADAGPCQRSRLVDCLGRPSTRSLLHHGAVRSSVRSRELRPSVQSTRALLTWPSLLAFPLAGRPARPPKPLISTWMRCTRGES